MAEQLTVRLPRELARALSDEAERRGLNRSDVVRMALRTYLESTAEAEERPFERVRHLVGAVRSGVRDLGTRHREHILRKLRGRGRT